MADQPGPKVALTRAQIEEGVGAELLSLLVGIAEDGKLAKDELVQLGLWLHRNRGGSLPGIAFLDATMTRILADGRISSAEQDELLGAIEKVLPIAWRKPARAARLEHLARRKQARREALARVRQAEKEAKRDTRVAERLARAEARDRRRSDSHFDFMVAGVTFEGRDRAARALKPGDRLRIRPEPGNPKDANAMVVHLVDGRQVGYVPRSEAGEVARRFRESASYVATVKKVFPGETALIPIVILRFYRADQTSAIADLAPDPCESEGQPPRPWWMPW